MKHLSNVSRGGLVILIAIATFGIITYFQNNEIITRSETPDGWVLFTAAAGYSFYYPPDSYVQTGTNKDNKYAYNFLTLLYDNQGEIVTFYIVENPEKLPLEQFIQTEQALDAAELTELWKKADLSFAIATLQIANQQALVVTQSEATFPLTGTCQQVTYIPHNKRVIAAKLCPAKRGVWELGYKADPQGEKLYYQVLNSLQLYPVN